MTRRRSLGRILRSRRVAVWLLGGVAAWGIIATIVPQTAIDPQGVARWAEEYGLLHNVVSAIGLHSAFTSPIFLAVMAYLGVSTILCAWERTGYALKVFGKAGHITGSEADRLRNRPALTVPVSSGIDSFDMLERASDALRSIRLHVSSGEVVAEGRAGRWGLLGSPVFHWSLALLIVVVAGGRLMRSEGFIGVPVGGSELDIAASYRGLEEGPLFLGHTEYEIAVPQMEREFMDGEVDRGAAPVVVVREGGLDLISQRVYPNNPLKYGSTTIHVSDYGFSPEISLETSSGEIIAQARPLLDIVEESTRSSTAGFDLTGASDEALFNVEMSIPFDTEEPSLDVVLIDTASGEQVSAARLVVGEALELPDGERLRFVATGDYARLSVVHDWSVPFIYALLVIGLAGLSVAVLSPYRRVLVMIVETGEGLAIHTLIRDKRRSAIFEDRVREVLERAVGDSISLSEEDR